MSTRIKKSLLDQLIASNSKNNPYDELDIKDWNDLDHGIYKMHLDNHGFKVFRGNEKIGEAGLGNNVTSIITPWQLRNFFKQAVDIARGDAKAQASITAFKQPINDIDWSLPEANVPHKSVPTPDKTVADPKIWEADQPQCHGVPEMRHPANGDVAAQTEKSIKITDEDLLNKSEYIVKNQGYKK